MEGSTGPRYVDAEMLQASNHCNKVKNCKPKASATYKGAGYFIAPLSLSIFRVSDTEQVVWIEGVDSYAVSKSTSRAHRGQVLGFTGTSQVPKVIAHIPLCSDGRHNFGVHVRSG